MASNNKYCLNAKGLAAHRKRRAHKESSVPGLAGQLAPAAA